MKNSVQKTIVTDKSIENAFNKNKGLPFSICMEAAGKDNELLGYLAYAYYKETKRNSIYNKNPDWSQKKKKQMANKYRLNRTVEEYETYFAKAKQCLTQYSEYVIDQTQIDNAIRFLKTNGCSDLINALQHIPDQVIKNLKELRYEQCQIVEQALPKEKSKWAKFGEAAGFNLLGSFVCFVIIVIGLFLVLKLGGVEHYNALIDKLRIEMPN